MKKTIIIFAIIIIFFIIYFLQANFFTWFTIAGIKPNIFVILIVFIALFASKEVSITFSIISGIFLDAIIAKKVGISGIMFGIISILGIYFDKNFSKDSRLTVILIITGATFLYEIGIYIINALISESILELIPFIKILLIEILYNALITITIYPLIKRAGHYVEEEFKGNKILTRYF